MALLIIPPSLAYCTLAGSLLPYLLSSTASSAYPTWRAGVPFLQTWVALDIGVLKARWRDSTGIILKTQAGDLSFSLFGCMSVRYVLFELCCLIPDGRGREGLGISVIDKGSH